MNLFPELDTDRLKLRKIGIDDIPALLKYGNNKKIADRILNIPYPYEEPTAVFRISYVVQGFKKGSRYIFAIELKEHQEFIGEISLHLEDRTKAQLGYWIGEPFWNRGIVTEALAPILKFGFEKPDMELIYATCHTDNPASAKVLEKNGLIRRGQRVKVMEYGLSRSEYGALQS